VPSRNNLTYLFTYFTVMEVDGITETEDLARRCVGGYTVLAEKMHRFGKVEKENFGGNG